VVPDMEQIIRDTGIEIELFPRVREE
jgi:hypothetical protein